MQASEFTTILAECCGEVLDAMYFTSVLGTTAHPGLQPVTDPEALAYSLRFTGDVHGTFGIMLSHAMARSLAANFLGEEEEALSVREVSEVVGELTNMLCGSVVSRVEGNSKFVLSHPEPYTPGSPASDILHTHLETDSGVIQIWVTVDTPSEPPVEAVLQEAL